METTSYFSELANFLLNGMGTNLFQKSNNMISGIAPVFQIGFGIYILLVAFDYYKRGFDENVVDLGKRMIGWLLIIAFAFNSSQYQKLANIMWMLPENLSGLLGTSTYTASALDTQSNNILKMMENIFAYAASLDMLQVSDKLMLYIGGTVAVIIGLFVLSHYICLLPNCQTIIGDGNCHRTYVYRFNVVSCNTAVGHELDRTNP